jgi:hypothetical protein
VTVIFISAIFSSVDVAIGAGYVSLTGGSTLNFQSINLSKVSQGLLPEPLEVSPVTFAKAEEITIVKNFRQAKASNTSLLQLIPLDKMLPLKELAAALQPALTNVINKAMLPKSVEDSINQTIYELTSSNNLEQFAKQDADSLFGPDVMSKTDDMMSRIDNFSENGCLDETYIDDLREYTRANNDFFTYLPSHLSHVNDTINALPDQIRDLAKDVKTQFIGGFTRSDGIVSALMSVLTTVWEAADTFGMTPIVHVTNLLNNVFIWPLPYWASCISISAHFLILGQVIVVIELWIRRRNQMSHDSVLDDFLTGSGSSSSSSSDRSRSKDEKDDIAYWSRREPEVVSDGSPSSMFFPSSTPV